ncbi:MAG: glycosyltransferase family 2 protein [Actinobacteria bacterium]|nr:glycosyltransferase family 2 protein [Actinomycetota bacterium]
MRAAAFEPGATPPLSTDLHRYAWDARVQASGINPYRYAPDDARLARLRDDVVWPEINLKSWRTVYPPGAEASFLSARVVFGHGLRVTTWLFLLAEAAAAGLLLLVLARLGAPLERIAVLAWHPLAVSEIAANGHVDALALLAGAGLLASWQARRFAFTGVAVAFGALVKLGPVLLLPALVRRGGRRFVGVVLTLVALAYVPYLGAGGLVVGSIADYVDRQRFGGSLYWVTGRALGDASTAFVLAAILLVIVLFVALREHDAVEQVARSCLLVVGGLLLVAGYVQPWHALALLPFLVVVPARGWLWLTGTLPLLYLFDDGALPSWVRPAVYGPFAAWIAWRLLTPRRPPLVALEPLPARPGVAAVIPALDEVDALPALLQELPDGVVNEIVVVDGGSRDGTPDAARAQGARVVVEPRRGYGRACATGAAATDADVIIFFDGDGSDDPAALPMVLEPVLAGRAAISLGSRVVGEAGAQLPHQRLGNALVTLLLRLVYGLRVHDVPPMRAVRRDALAGLALRELTYGWPTEMLVKAARTGLPVEEVGIPWRVRRGGHSKISGRLGPSARAGATMLRVVARYS